MKVSQALPALKPLTPGYGQGWEMGHVPFRDASPIGMVLKPFLSSAGKRESTWAQDGAVLTGATLCQGSCADSEQPTQSCLAAHLCCFFCTFRGIAIVPTPQHPLRSSLFLPVGASKAYPFSLWHIPRGPTALVRAFVM